MTKSLLHPDGHRLFLGKQEAKYDRNLLRFSKYRSTLSTNKLPALPAQFGHEEVYPSNGWGMLGNGPDDSVTPGFQGAGDCFWAGSAHETMLINKTAGRDVVFTGANVISDYSAQTGYQIGNDATDQGTILLDGLKYRQKTGIVDAAGVRHKIGAYLALEPGNLHELYEAIYIFGICGIGIQVPSSAMDQFSEGVIWSVVPGATIEGGHYIPMIAKRANPKLITWGQTFWMTEAFYKKYNDESYVYVSPEMLNNRGVNVQGFNMTQLQADMGLL